MEPALQEQHLTAAPPPPPPPSYAAATQELAYYSNPQPMIQSPTRRGPPRDDDGISESIDSSKYKTRLCQTFMMGAHCTFGGRCAFAHGHQELRNAPSPSLAAPPPPPSYHEFAAGGAPVGSPGPSSPLHSRPQTPRGSAFPTVNSSANTDTLLSPTRMLHPRNSLPSSPVTSGPEQGFPQVGANAAGRFRNEPYSPNFFVNTDK